MVSASEFTTLYPPGMPRTGGAPADEPEGDDASERSVDITWDDEGEVFDLAKVFGPMSGNLLLYARELASALDDSKRLARLTMSDMTSVTASMLQEAEGLVEEMPIGFSDAIRAIGKPDYNAFMRALKHLDGASAVISERECAFIFLAAYAAAADAASPPHSEYGETPEDELDEIENLDDGAY